MHDKERLLGGHRQPEREVEEPKKGKEKQRQAPGKVTLIDQEPSSLAAAPGKVTLTELRKPPRASASVGKVTRTMFTPADIVVKEAWRLVDDILDRREERSRPFDSYAHPRDGGIAAPEAVAEAMAHASAGDAGLPFPADVAAKEGEEGHGDDILSLRDEARRAVIRGELLTLAHALALEPDSLEVMIDDFSASRLGAGRVYHPDGTITENVTRAFIQRNPDGTLNAGFPVTDSYTF